MAKRKLPFEYAELREEEPIYDDRYTGKRHVRVIVAPKGRIADLQETDAVLQQGSYMPAEWGGPVEPSVLSPMLQGLQRRQSPEGAQDQLVLEYVEVHPRGSEVNDDAEEES